MLGCWRISVNSLSLKCARLLQYIIRNTDLTDVVQQCPNPQRLQFVSGQFDGLSNSHGILTDPLAVIRGVTVACVQSVGQRSGKFDVDGLQAIERVADRGFGTVEAVNQLANLR